MGGLEPETGRKHPEDEVQWLVFRLPAAGRGRRGVRSLVTAGSGKDSGAVSGVGMAAGAAQPAGTKALATVGRSVQPSMC